jgi:hypothetical protein
MFCEIVPAVAGERTAAGEAVEGGERPTHNVLWDAWVAERLDNAHLHHNVLRGAWVAERLDNAHLHHNGMVDALGPLMFSFRQRASGHRDASRRVRGAPLYQRLSRTWLRPTTRKRCCPASSS